MVEAPAAFGAVEGSRGRHVGAVEDRLHLERAVQLVRFAGDEGSKILPDLREATLRDLHLGGDFGGSR